MYVTAAFAGFLDVSTVRAFGSISISIKPAGENYHMCSAGWQLYRLYSTAHDSCQLQLRVVAVITEAVITEATVNHGSSQ